VSKVSEIECDGCGRRARASVENAGLPAEWRRLSIHHGIRHWNADVCSPGCASRAVDRTFEKEDREAAERAILRAVP
jgi:hypothetical protein